MDFFSPSLKRRAREAVNVPTQSFAPKFQEGRSIDPGAAFTGSRSESCPWNACPEWLPEINIATGASAVDGKLFVSSNLVRRAGYGVVGAGLIVAGVFGSWPHMELRAQGYSKPADLGLSAVVSAEVVEPGDIFNLQYTVSNAGSGSAHNVVLVTSQNNGKSKVISTFGCLEDPVPAQWCTVALPNGQLTPGQSATVVMDFEVGARAPSGPIIVESVVSATEPDPNPGNEYNSTTLNIVSPPLN